MIINIKFDLMADSGYVLRNRYTGNIQETVENETDIAAWVEIEKEQDPEPEQA